MSIASTAVIQPHATLAEDARIGEFVIIGEWQSDNPPPAAIGPGAVIRSHTVIYAGVQIGANFQTGHGVLIRQHTRIGDDVSIGSHSAVEHHVKIGHRVRIHTGVFIPELTTLEDDCWIGPRVVFTNAPHPRCANIPHCLEGITIKSGAKIGANVTILPGITIGENALVGAGSVVRKDVAPGTVVTGSPAVEICGIDKLRCSVDNLPPYR